MKQTPVHDAHNPDLLKLMPTDAQRIVEVGCSSGVLAREYKKLNEQCHYTGIDIDPDYVTLANRYCDTAISADIEDPGFNLQEQFGDVDCWVFGDTLEHLRDPWSILKSINEVLPPGGSVVACIPNAQHWSLQARLSIGDFRYEDSGLLDRTHLRWFTRETMLELFSSTGYRIDDGIPRTFSNTQPNFDTIINCIRHMAISVGGNPDLAVEDALPLQYVVRAVPNGQS